MPADRLSHLLRQLRAGAISVESARAEILAPGADAPVGQFAKVDIQRAERCGAPEVVFGQGKTVDQVAAILGELVKHGQPGLATRISAEDGHALIERLSIGRYNPVARTFHLGESLDPRPRAGKVIIVTAGTSDLPVAEEAREVASAWGCEVTLLVDVGVAGLHRLLSRLDVLEDADALVVVAGMEGALPSVVGGLVDCPVIAVPTSIGYGASLGGIAALLGMLNSCASNVTVVNIDAGFNGGYVAGLIASRAGQARARQN